MSSELSKLKARAVLDYEKNSFSFPHRAKRPGRASNPQGRKEIIPCCTGKETQTTEIREHMRGGNKAAEIIALAREIPKNLRLYSLIRLAPGASIGYHVHENETELFHFLTGSGVADDNGTPVRVSAGDTLSTPSGTGHSVENDGSEDLTFLAVIVRD